MSSGDLVKVWCAAVFHAVNRRRTDKSTGWRTDKKVLVSQPLVSYLITHREGALVRLTSVDKSPVLSVYLSCFMHQEWGSYYLRVVEEHSEMLSFFFP